MYDVALGSALIFIAKMVAAVICHILGGLFFADWVNSRLAASPTFQRVKRQAGGSSSFKLILLLRLSPLPSYVCSYSAPV